MQRQMQHQGALLCATVNTYTALMIILNIETFLISVFTKKIRTFYYKILGKTGGFSYGDLRTVLNSASISSCMRVSYLFKI